MSEDIENLIKLPDYDPPTEELGTKSDYSGWWTKSLEIYKDSSESYDKKWVYTSIKSESKNIAVIIYDRYPKAKFHLLVLPLLVDANNPSEFRKEHLDMLKVVHTLSRIISNHLQVKCGSGPIRIGYHAKPSMDDLHIHIISEDFDSPFLKNKQHYNSFTKDSFFIDIDYVEEMLETNSKLDIKPGIKSELNSQIECHICKKPITRPAIIGIKKHLQKHLNN